MTSAARLALIGAAGVAAVAAAVVVADPFGSDTDPVARSVVTTSAAPSPSPSATRSTPSTTPSETPTPTPTGPAPLTVEDATAAAPVPGGGYTQAEVAVELSAVCEGASLELAEATPLYASLQTTEAPLRYLDTAIAVYDSPDDATRAFEQLATDVAACPLTRSVTPTPTPSATASAAPISVEGATMDVTLHDLPVLQWVQVQTAAAPQTQLRSAVTVAQVANSLLVVSLDQDSETISSADLSSASLRQTDHISAKLVTAAEAD